MASEWLQHIGEALRDSLGSREQRVAAYRLAAEVELSLPHGTRNAEALSALVRRLFERWIEDGRYLMQPAAVDHRLPETTCRSDIEVATEYNLTSAKAVQAKQEQLEQARTRRIERCAEHLAAGWPEHECIGFVAARDEWRRAKERARWLAA